MRKKSRNRYCMEQTCSLFQWDTEQRNRCLLTTCCTFTLNILETPCMPKKTSSDTDINRQVLIKLRHKIWRFNLHCNFYQTVLKRRSTWSLDRLPGQSIKSGPAELSQMHRHRTPSIYCSSLAYKQAPTWLFHFRQEMCR